MTQFMSVKARTAHFNLEENKKDKKYLTEDETKMLMCSIVLLHLNYDNQSLVNPPIST